MTDKKKVQIKRNKETTTKKMNDKHDKCEIERINVKKKSLKIKTKQQIKRNDQ